MFFYVAQPRYGTATCRRKNSFTPGAVAERRRMVRVPPGFTTLLSGTSAPVHAVRSVLSCGVMVAASAPVVGIRFAKVVTVFSSAERR